MTRLASDSVGDASGSFGDASGAVGDASGAVDDSSGLVGDASDSVGDACGLVAKVGSSSVVDPGVGAIVGFSSSGAGPVVGVLGGFAGRTSDSVLSPEGLSSSGFAGAPAVAGFTSGVTRFTGASAVEGVVAGATDVSLGVFSSSDEEAKSMSMALSCCCDI